MESGRNMAGGRTVLIMAGGTGGHVYPALSIARCLRGQGIDVQWLGTRQGLEADVIPRAGFPIHFITVSGLRGKSRWKQLLAPVVVLGAVGQALARMLKIKPHCVLGMGGFATGPGGIAAWLTRRPLLIHEQNAIAGFTNQLLFPFAHTVMQGFPRAFERKRALGGVLPRWLVRTDRAVTVGNPVREEICQVPAPAERLAGRQGPLRLLVLGGSLGAVAINRLLPGVLASMGDQRPQVRHQCGRRNLEETRDWYRQHGLASAPGIEVAAYIEDMAEAYAWADLVLCRAGALTTAEITAAGVASILVPYPHAVDDHQTANARVLEQAGAGVLVPQDELEEAVLRRWLTHYHDRRALLLTQAEQARALALPHATRAAADYCLEACHG